jgi:hypothetical protein
METNAITPHSLTHTPAIRSAAKVSAGLVCVVILSLTAGFVLTAVGLPPNLAIVGGAGVGGGAGIGLIGGGAFKPRDNHPDEIDQIYESEENSLGVLDYWDTLSEEERRLNETAFADKSAPSSDVTKCDNWNRLDGNESWWEEYFANPANQKNHENSAVFLPRGHGWKGLPEEGWVVLGPDAKLVWSPPIS